MRIHVSNLAAATTNDALNHLFAQYGTVASATLTLDGFTGLSRGFGYVEMPDDAEGALAIIKLNGTVLHEQPIVVVQAAPEHGFRQGTYRVLRREDFK